MKKPTATPHDLERREQAPLITPTDLERRRPATSPAR